MITATPPSSGEDRHVPGGSVCGRARPGVEKSGSAIIFLLYLRFYGKRRMGFPGRPHGEKMTRQEREKVDFR